MCDANIFVEVYVEKGGIRAGARLPPQQGTLHEKLGACGPISHEGSLLGEEACALTNSAFFDINFNKNIRVAHRGRYVDIGSPYLGVCVGPRARVSAGVFVAHGREIPAGALLVKPPDEIANRIGEIRPDEPAAVSGGTVVSLNPDKTSG